MGHKAIRLPEHLIVSFVVCQKCDSIYHYDDCYDTKANGEKVSRKCRYVCYPNHPHASKCKECGYVLMKQVKIKGKSTLKPKKYIHTIH